jgi:hypothetical protein
MAKKRNEDKDILKYLKQQQKEAQRNVTMTQKAMRKGPAPEMGSWNRNELQSMNKFYKEQRAAQSNAQKLIRGQRDLMAGRTVEAGTRSMLEGLRGMMRGGGLRRGSM